MRLRRRPVARLQRAVAASGLLCAAGMPGYAQDLSDNRADAPVKVLVTGSNIPQIDRESGLPLQVITREQIDRASIQTAFELINTISAVTGSGSSSENLFVAGNAQPGFGGLGLRGLTYQRTLVLVNGRRIANYAFTGSATDVTMIPMAAVERVEVLLDGASAIYGSDAIGGVINFILRKDFHGVEASAQYSSPQETGGWSDHFTLTGGYGRLAEDRFNVYATVDYQRFGALAARDRDFSRSQYIPGATDQTTQTSFPANVLVGNRAVNPGGNPANGYADPPCAPPQSFTTTSPTRCNFDPAHFVHTISASERLTTTAAFTWQFAPEHKFFLQGLYARNSFDYVAAPTAFSASPPVFMLPPSSPYYPHDFAAHFGLDGRPLTVLWRSVDLGGRTDRPVTEQWNVVSGIQGTLAGWSYDGAFTYGVDSIDDRYVGGYVYGSQILRLLNSGVVNPFGYNTPDVVQALEATQVNGTVRRGYSSNTMVDFRATKPVYELPAGPLTVAMGAEARRWRLTEAYAPALESGDVVQVGRVLSFTATRDIWAVFAEVNAPLVDRLEADFAARFDHYSDVGSTTNPKISLRWQPDRTLLLRSSVGTGFRAPGLEGLYTPNTSGFVSGGTPAITDPARCPVTGATSDCTGPFQTLNGGRRDLQSEKSSQWGFGAVWSPVRELTLSADYFDVIVDNLIVLYSASATLSGCPDGMNGPTCSYIVRDPADPANPALPGRIRYFDQRLTNIGKIRTNGVDVSTQYHFPKADWGLLALSVQGTYLIKQVQQQSDGSYANHVDRELSTPPFGAVSRWRHYLTLDWTFGPWIAQLSETFQKGTLDANTIPGQMRRIGDYDVWNLSGSYSGFKDWQFSAGVKNIFNRDPPFSNQTWGAGNGSPAATYDPTYTSPIGRLFWGSVKFSFK